MNRRLIALVVFAPFVLPTPDKVVAEEVQRTLADIVEDNPTLPDVERQFRNLRIDGEWMAANLQSGQWTSDSYGSDGVDHYQDMTRATYHPCGPNNVIYVTKSGDNDAGRKAFLGVIHLATRTDSDATNGERLRSNLIERDEESSRTSPASSDRVIRRIEYDHWKHPGGCQMVGDILAVPFEQPYNDVTHPRSQVYFYNCIDRLNPVKLDYELTVRYRYGLYIQAACRGGCCRHRETHGRTVCARRDLRAESARHLLCIERDQLLAPRFRIHAVRRVGSNRTAGTG